MTEVDDVEPGRMQGQDSPPAANQRTTEPMPPSEGQRVPDAAGARDVSDEPAARDVNVPGETPAEGTSEAMEPVDGVRLTALAPEGHADGETDNRMPPTTTF